MSNIKNYKYDWYWDKKFSGNFVQAKRMPSKSIETISVFNNKPSLPSYFPIMIQRDKPIKQGGTRTADAIPIKNNSETHTSKIYKDKYPVTRLDFPRDIGNTTHPTQKPVALFEYLIKTYTNEGALILDNCAGSGTTAIACENTNRNWICMEKDETYANAAIERIRKHVEDNNAKGLPDESLRIDI